MDWIGLDLTFPITDPTWIFLLVLLIILFAPILLNKLRSPHIIGMILAGLAIGEHGFNILALAAAAGHDALGQVTSSDSLNTFHS